MSNQDIIEELDKTLMLIKDAKIRLKDVNRRISEVSNIFVEINQLILEFKEESRKKL